MAFERNPDDLSRPTPGNDERLRGAAQFDSNLQPDPELAEGRAGGGRVALFAIAIVAILGVVLYGLNNASMTSPEGTPTAQTTSPPAGQTTGSATSAPRPALPPAANNRAPAAPQDSGAPANGAAK